MEYWYSNTVYVTKSSNGKIGVTLYYGSNRQYAIKKSEEIKGDEEKQIKAMLKDIREEKRNVSPIHGFTHYMK